MSDKGLLSELWQDYTDLNPSALRIYNALLERESSIQNDHIALRTFNLPEVGLAKLAAPFLKLGYTAQGEYHFTEKKLYACHYEHHDKTKPKVFISELLTEKFSQKLQTSVQELIAQVPISTFDSPRLPALGRPWKLSHALYQELYQESEYAAWMAAYGFRANHFTIFFNSMKTFKDLPDLNDFVKALSFRLNSSGGEIKGSKEVLLEQSSTMAEKVKVDFTDGTFEVPACYYEFARRYPMPNGELYQGFVTQSADKIFESTNSN